MKTVFGSRAQIFMVALSLLAPLASQAASDTRVAIELPPPMRAHMLANMRDHLATLHEIQAALARDDAGRAAQIAEQRGSA